MLWEVPLAVNGPADESDLLVSLEPAKKVANARTPGPSPGTGEGRKTAAEPPEESLWVADHSETAQAAAVAGQNLWKWLMGAALVCLLLELGIVAAPMLGKEAGR